MNQLVADKTPKNYDPACGDLMIIAERELAAFVSVVTESFGPRTSVPKVRLGLSRIVSVVCDE